MNLSKSNKKRVEGWEVLGMPISLAEMPLLWGYVLNKEGKFKVLVIKWPSHSTKQSPVTPVWYESPVFDTKKEAVANARENCT